MIFFSEYDPGILIVFLKISFRKNIYEKVIDCFNNFNIILTLSSFTFNAF